MTYYGEFGNANVNYIKDWKAIINAVGYSATLDTASNKCTLTNEIQIQILTSTAGFTENPQNYILGIRKVPVSNTIEMRDGKTYWPMKVSVEFFEVSESETNLDAFNTEAGWGLPSDFLWPFMTISSSSNLLLGLTAVAGLVIN